MMNDPIIEEIRRVRQAHAAKHNNDIAEICKALKLQEQLSLRPVVNLERKSHRTIVAGAQHLRS